jgi:uncharacterized protein
MKTILKILVLTALVLLVSCLLAPPVFWLSRWLALSGYVPQLGRFGFSTFFNRTAMVVGLSSVWPLLRWLGLTHWRDLGLEPNPRRGTDLGLGVLIGAGGFAYALIMLFVGHIVRIHDVVPWASAWTFVLTAIAVPLIEESFFRGVLFGLLRRTLRWPYALAFLSFFFAILHFLGPKPGGPRASGQHWYSGFEHLQQLFWQFGEPSLVLGGWVTLFMVGWILGYTVVRTRSLYLAMGLHGGWVLAMRFYDEFCQRVNRDNIWIGKDVRVGLAAVLLLAATYGLVFLLLRRRPPTATETPATPPEGSS